MMLEEFLRHSAKGSTWKKHKYIKKIDGTYYYPDSYDGGRHLSDDKRKPPRVLSEKEKTGEGAVEENKEESSEKKIWEWGAEELTEENIEELARLVIEGRFGNGQTRKDLLGEEYQRIQNRVNKILLGDAYEEPKIISGKRNNDEKMENDTTPLEQGMKYALNAAERNIQNLVKAAGMTSGRTASNIPVKKRQNGQNPKAERTDKRSNLIKRIKIDEQLEKQRKKR